MNIAKRYIKASAWAAGIKYFFMVINFLGQIVLARMLLPEYFGIVTLAVSILGVLNIFLSFSVNMAYIYLPDSKTLFSSSLVISVISWSILVFLALIAFIPIYNYYDFQIALFVLLMAVVKIFGSIAVLLLAKLEKKVDFKLSALLSSLGGTLALILAVGASFINLQEYSLLLREIFTPVFVFLFVIIYTKEKLCFKMYNVHEMKEIIKYSIKMIFSRGSEIMYLRIPFIIIATYFDKNTLGYLSQMFYLANLLNTALMTFNAQVAFVFFSQFKNDKKRTKKGLVYINVINILLGIPVFIVFYYFPYELLFMLWGDKWTSAAVYLQMFSIFAVLFPMFNSIKSYFYGSGKNSIVTIAYIIGLLFYIVLLLVWPFNIMLALGFSLSLMLMILFMLFRLWK